MKKEVVYSNFDKYNGQFLKDFRHGTGDYIFSNGDKLICEWEHNRVDGNVVFTSTSGLIYKSKWHNGQPIGNPKLFNNNKNNTVVANEIENKLRKIGKYRLSFSQINKSQNLEPREQNLEIKIKNLTNKKNNEKTKTIDKNLKKFYFRKLNFKNYFIGLILLHLFLFVAAIIHGGPEYENPFLQLIGLIWLIFFIIAFLGDFKDRLK